MAADTPGALAPSEHDRDSTTALATTGHAPPVTRGRGLGAVRDAVVAFLGSVLAIVPHVLHHIGLLAGAAFLTGAGGNALFYALGMVASIPMLSRLHRRFGSWRAPVIAIGAFTAVFSLSAFVIGPAISGAGDDLGRSPSVPSQEGPPPDPHGH